MRIISLVVTCLILGNLVFPQYVSAAETINTDEIKIKFKIQNSALLSSQAAYVSLDDALGIIPYNSPGYMPIKTKDELHREKILARYKNRIASAVFPEGKFIINASAYTAAADECGKDDGITASGLVVKERHTVACPPQFPLGTKIKIEGYGTYVCEDRGGAIKGNHFDIYMKTKKQAFTFGRRNLMAEVVK